MLGFIFDGCGVISLFSDDMEVVVQREGHVFSLFQFLIDPFRDVRILEHIDADHILACRSEYLQIGIIQVKHGAVGIIQFDSPG